MKPHYFSATTILLLVLLPFSAESFFSSTSLSRRKVQSFARGDKGGGAAVSLNAQRWQPDIIGGPQSTTVAADFSADASRRRLVIGAGSAAIVGTVGGRPTVAAAASKEKGPALPRLLPLVKEARSQLDAVPPLIEARSWDSVRAILIKPPLSDCWTKGSYPALLQDYAAAIGDELLDGDELAALEAREEARTHLRYLDMAVYNNVFNPIATEGESGATKELIRSYYEDPVNELKASVAALDELVKLASQ